MSDNIDTRTVAERLHEAYTTIQHVESTIGDAFKKYEPEIYEYLDYHISADDYDNSIEVYIDTILPSTYIPSDEVKKVIKDMGFAITYWNFINEDGKYFEEIIGNSPRRKKHGF